MFAAGIIFSVFLFVGLIMTGRLLLKHVGFRYIMPIAHSVVILLFSIWYFSSTSQESSMSLVLWFIPTILDFPFTLIYPQLAKGSSTTLAIITFVGGGAWYFIIGWIIDLKILASKKGSRFFRERKIEPREM